MRFIAVWLFGVFVVVLLLGSCLYAAEGGQNLMDSIPVAMWWLSEVIIWGPKILNRVPFKGVCKGYYTGYYRDIMLGL